MVLQMMDTALLIHNDKDWTDAELEKFPKDGRKYELLDGDFLTSPITITHGTVCVRIATLLDGFVRPRKLGLILDSSIGCRLTAQCCLSPDVCFVSKARLPELAPTFDQFLAGAPDLVVEVISPSDRRKNIDRKMERYFEHGARLGWIVDSRKQVVTVRTSKIERILSGPRDILEGGDVLPGFKCKVAEIFALNL